MRILLSTVQHPPFGYGGVGVYTDYLARVLSRMGHVAHVVTAGEALSRRIAPGHFVHYLPFPDRSPFGTGILGDALAWSMTLWQAAEEIDRRWGIDLIETPNNVPEAMHGLMAARAGKHPVVVRMSTPTALWQVNDGWKLEGERLTVCAVEEGLLNCARGLIANTHAVLEDARRCFTLPEGLRPQVIHPGLPADYGVLSPPSDMNDEVRVLVLSRLQPSKGARALLAAIPPVLARDPRVRFDIVARDVPPWTFGADFRKSRPDLLDRVKFHSGITEDRKKELLRRCHMMVAPSHYESFGMMYVEAMAFGRATIGCPVGGVPEIVLDGRTGLLVKPDDERALAEAILSLAADPTRCARMGQAGYERFLERFTVERMARESLAFYQSVLERREP
jgi:glycosyltransferase involved in cell wall biosynthesis